MSIDNQNEFESDSKPEEPMWPADDVPEVEETIDPFFGDPEFTLDDVTVVSAKVTKPYEGPEIESPLAILQGLHSHVRKHLEAEGITQEFIEQQIEQGNSNWVYAFIKAFESTTSDSDTMESIVTKPGTNWTTRPEHDGVPIGPSRTRTAFSKQNVSTVSGTDAIRLYDSFTSSGRTFEIPLWHSGIWLYIKRPTLAESMTLDSKITLDKINMGRNTRGASFSNDEFFIAKNVLDFAMDHCFDHSVKNATVDQVREMIDYRDIQSIAWGLALTEYPSGFPFEQVCTRDINKCSHTTSEIVNLAMVHRVNSNAFTAEQHAFMGGVGKKRTIEEVLKYRESTMADNRTFKVNENVSIVVTCPTAEESIASGYQWANEIRTATSKAFSTSIDDGNRKVFESNQALATRLRNYSHWISKIVMTNADDEATATVEDRESIHILLNKMSSDRKERIAIQTAVEEYIVRAVNVVIGTPNYKCPSCGSFMMDRSGPETVIIPWDALGVFFNLQQFKITRNMQD